MPTTDPQYYARKILDHLEGRIAGNYLWLLTTDRMEWLVEHGYASDLEAIHRPDIADYDDQRQSWVDLCRAIVAS